MKPIQPTVIVLCAGRSERFKAHGGQGNKLDALLGEVGVKHHVIRAAQLSGLDLCIVEPKAVEHILNPGMSDSIASGVSLSKLSNGWLILPADLPLIQSATIELMGRELAKYQELMNSDMVTVAPVFEGQRGHPVGFSSGFLSRLTQLSGDEGAKEILSEYPPVLIQVQDPGCVLDVDTPELLEKVRKIWINRT
jgi:molybdenum cofactor cytidylyltransferase